MSPSPLRLPAPAKINLYLHVTGKRKDGYHLLDSLAVFAQGIEDDLTLTPSKTLTLDVKGPFAGDFGADDLKAGEESSNLAVRAAQAYAKASARACPVSITLEKKLPMGAGLGGGSADAAAVMHGMERLFGTLPEEKRNALLLSLGADVPVCYAGRACRFEGVGDIISATPSLPSLFLLLVWPGAPSMTKDVFSRIAPADYLPRTDMPEQFGDEEAFLSFLSQTTNSLTQAAFAGCPVIADALERLAAQNGCRLARMSGSGSCVFGLFDNPEALNAAETAIASRHSDWWIRAGRI